MLRHRRFWGWCRESAGRMEAVIYLSHSPDAPAFSGLTDEGQEDPPGKDVCLPDTLHPGIPGLLVLHGISNLVAIPMTESF